MSARNWLRTAAVQMDLSLKVVFRFGLSYENDLAFYPIPLRIRVHILQTAQAEHKTGTLNSQLLMGDSNDLDSRNIAGSHYLY